MRIIIGALAAFIIFAVIYLIFSNREKERENMAQRLEYFSSDTATGMLEATGQQKVAGDTLQGQILDKIRTLAAGWRKNHQNAGLDFLMQQADWPLFGAEFQMILGLLGVAVGIFLVLLTFNPIMFLFGLGGTIAAGFIYVKIHIARRRAAFVGQLGDTLNMVSNALRAGFSFMQAVELISKEMDAPIGSEFQKVLNEINLGGTLEDSLEAMGKRVASSDYDLMVTAVLIQRQVGGNLAQVLDSISNTINERIRMKNEISSLTAQGKLSGLIVGLIPIFIVCYLLSVNPHYFDPMVESLMGKIMLVAGVLFEIIAVYIIKNIVDIDA